jgi:hypothetical protein
MLFLDFVLTAGNGGNGDNGGNGGNGAVQGTPGRRMKKKMERI